MAINPLSGVGSANFAGTAAPSTRPAAAEKFKQAMRPQNSPVPPRGAASAQPHAVSSHPPAASPTPNAQHTSVASHTAPVEKARASGSTQVLERIGAAQRQMDEVLKLAESGRSFSPAELLSLQAQVYQASQELDLAGKVVEKATGGIKQVLQTQV